MSNSLPIWQEEVKRLHLCWVLPRPLTLQLDVVTVGDSRTGSNIFLVERFPFNFLLLELVYLFSCADDLSLLACKSCFFLKRLAIENALESTDSLTGRQGSLRVRTRRVRLCLGHMNVYFAEHRSFCDYNGHRSVLLRTIFSLKDVGIPSFLSVKVWVFN